MKDKCFFPQTITPEYEVNKKLQQCQDVSLYIYCIYTYLNWVGTEPDIRWFVCVCVSFCSKFIVNIQTRWSSHRWQTHLVKCKLPSTPNSWVMYVKSFHYYDYLKPKKPSLPGGSWTLSNVALEKSQQSLLERSCHLSPADNRVTS